MITKLIAAPGSATTSYVELDLKEGIPVSINKGIADIREPDKRTGAFSKSITLPGTKINHKFFEFAFEANITSSNWNSNLKAPAFITVDSIEIHRGHLQLTNITRDGDKIDYSVVVYGDNSSLFTTISDAKLEDLDFSAYNHSYTRPVQKATWSATKGSGVFYPIIDYGHKQLSNDHYYHVEHLRPALYVREYLNKIFTAAGKTWTSTFLDGTFFKSLYIPHNGQSFNMSASTLANYEFYAGRLSTSSVQNIPLTYVGGVTNGWENNVSTFNTSAATTLLCNDDSTAPFHDAGGIYNTATGVYTASGFVERSIDIKGTCKFEIKINFTSGAVSATGGKTAVLALMKSVDGGNTWVYQGGYNYPNFLGSSQHSSSYQSATLNFSFPAIKISGTNQLKIVYIIDSGLDNDTLRQWTGANGTGSQVTTGTSSFDLRQTSGCAFEVVQTNKNYLQGETIVVNDAIPKNYKQRDFIMSIVKMFKLQFDVDKTNPSNYIIEPRDTFLGSGTTRDWTYKLAEDFPIEVRPMGELKSKVYEWTYTRDSDYYNTIYQNDYGEAYGTKTKIVGNDFLKDKYTTQVMFSPTPVVDNAQTVLVVPKIYAQNASNQVSPLTHNIRILINGGLISGSWLHRENVGNSFQDNSETTYPYSGMTDHPFSNTVSIEFGIPSKIYYYDPAYLYTDNNLYSAYHYREFSEVTDRDSKIVTAFFDLSPGDVYSFDFRDIIFIKNAYYYVNKFEYDPSVRSLTKVELLKLKGYAAYVPVSLNAGDINTNTGMG